MVYKQAEKKGRSRPIDEGINTIFEKAELTSEKAEDLETRGTTAFKESILLEKRV